MCNKALNILGKGINNNSNYRVRLSNLFKIYNNKTDDETDK